MSTRKHDPAYASATVDSDSPGITKREYFTGQALIGLLASHPTNGGEPEEGYYANMAVRIADNVIDALNKKEVSDVG